MLTDEAAEEVNGFPMVGRVQAGAMMEAIEQQERLDVTKLWPQKGTYVLEVEGDSMIDAQIASAITWWSNGDIRRPKGISWSPELRWRSHS